MVVTLASENTFWKKEIINAAFLALKSNKGLAVLNCTRISSNVISRK
jgi:hypothetical protein